MLVFFLIFFVFHKFTLSYSPVYNYGHVLALFQSCFICIFIIIHI